MWNSLSAESKQALIVPKQFQKVCSAITTGVRPAVVALVVLVWQAGSGRIAVMVLIAVHSGMSCRLGRLVLALRGSASVSDSGFVFISLSFISFLVCM